MKIQPGDGVMLVLHTPREKLFGILDEINAAGVSVRGVDLGYFDYWCRSIANGEQYLKVVGAALTHPVSRNWKGYWQRREA